MKRGLVFVALLAFLTGHAYALYSYLFIGWLLFP